MQTKHKYMQNTCQRTQKHSYMRCCSVIKTCKNKSKCREKTQPNHIVANFSKVEDVELYFRPAVPVFYTMLSYRNAVLLGTSKNSGQRSLTGAAVSVMVSIVGHAQYRTNNNRSFTCECHVNSRMSLWANGSSS